MPTKTAAIKTLGCKLNQFEGEQMREQLVALGYRLVGFDDPADVYIINSCTVTTSTARNCRRLCRKAKRQAPQALLIATGCYAEVEPEALEQIEAIDIVVDNAARGRLAEFVPAVDTEVHLPEVPYYSETGPMIHRMTGHTRAFVKVQEGCNARCAYCIIPYARGPSRSVPSTKVKQQVKLLLEAGHPEIVLIGTHPGQYGADLPEDIDLAGLIAKLCEMSQLQRLRLSSIEPCEITHELVKLVAGGGHSLDSQPNRPGQGKLSRHWHIPLQSGCDEILRRMGRPYDTAFYQALIERIKAAEPDTAIGADVIVGFPGETDQQFEQTRAFIESLPLSYLHVFTYSTRPLTPAADMPNQVPGNIRKQRNHILRAISEQKRAAFAQSMVGQQLEVVVEQFSSTSQTTLSAITDNYLRVVLEGPKELIRNVVRIEVTGAQEAVLDGELISQPVAS